MKKKAIIVGVSGQDGAYLSKFLLQKNYEVYGFTRNLNRSNLYRLEFLNVLNQIQIIGINLNDFRVLLETIKNINPHEIYNLAAQSSVAKSFQEPVDTLDSIIHTTLNLLEAIKFLGINVRFYNSSSSEMFGNVNFKADEKTNFNPHSPYGVSKASAHWLVQSYRNSYNLFACSGILFNHESPLRSPQFVTQKIIRHVVNVSNGYKGKLGVGNTDVVRDWGWAPDYVEGMWLMLQEKTPTDYVLASGKGHALKIFIEKCFQIFNLDWKKFVQTDKKLLRPFDINYSVGNPNLVKKKLGWKSELDLDEIIKRLINAELARNKSNNKRF